MGDCWGRPRTRWWDRISHLAWERLKIPPRGAGKRCCGEGHLDYFTEPAATATWPWSSEQWAVPVLIPSGLWHSQAALTQRWCHSEQKWLVEKIGNMAERGALSSFYNTSMAQTRKSEFTISQAEISIGTPLKLDSPTPTSKSSMADLCINLRESCSNVLFISTSVLFVSHWPTVQLLSVDMLLWRLYAQSTR